MTDIKIKGYYKHINGKMVFVPESHRDMDVKEAEATKHSGTLQKLLPPKWAPVIPHIHHEPKPPPQTQYPLPYASWGSKPKYEKPSYPEQKPHPKKNEHGEPVSIHYPHKETEAAAWTDPKRVATFIPGGAVPDELNGIPFAPWEDHPQDADDWDDVKGQMPRLEEPDMEPGEGKHPKAPAAGVIIEEADGRVWIIHPTNRFAGYKASFPKGHQDEGINLQASAIKEAYEESGLQVQITGFLMDVERTTTLARYYTAKRVGGSPIDMGWESQAVSLVPKSELYKHLNMTTDHGIAEAIGAGPAPQVYKKPVPHDYFAPDWPGEPVPWWDD
jgi:8-oxo-dGTP pyrophosphatase MutT (NUDIX family)